MSNVRILVIIEAEIATTHLIEQILKACGLHGVSYKVQFLDKLQTSDFVAGIIPLFVRCSDPLALSWTKALASARYPYTFYIDDNFWRILGDSPLAEYYRHPIVRHSLEFSISNAHAVITNSRELAKFLSQFNKSVSVLPTFFDFSLIEGVQPSSTEQIRIGFAGSPSRVDDLDLVSSLIVPILEKFPQAAFEFAGTLPKGIEANDRIMYFPHTQDYNSYIRFQAERNWAIGLAPLIDHEANRSKTDNKYREYGACRCAGIYSNIPPYNDVVNNSVTGLLVENTQSAWLEAVADLLTHPAKRAALAQSAFEDTKARYDIPQVSEAWADFFSEFAKRFSYRAVPLVEEISWPKKLRRRLDRARLNLAIVYYEGGLKLVIRRTAQKLRRLLERVISP